MADVGYARDSATLRGATTRDAAHTVLTAWKQGVESSDDNDNSIPSSSSPLRLFEKSLGTMEVVQGGDRLCQLPSHSLDDNDGAVSPPTSPCALVDGETRSSPSADVNAVRRDKALRPYGDLDLDASDSDAESDAGGSDGDGADRQAFLAKFRARLANTREHDIPLSSSLSEPPTESSRGAPARTGEREDSEQILDGARRLTPSAQGTALFKQVNGQTTQMTLTPTEEDASSSSYVTEQQKRGTNVASPTARRRKLEELAARARRNAASDDADSEDGISSSSEVHLEDDVNCVDGVARGKAIINRAPSDQVSSKSGAGKVLHFLGDSSASSDDDAAPQQVAARAKGPKKLNKKELEKMDKMRARIDREAKVRAIKVTAEERPRRVFHISDLLGKVAAAESSNAKHLKVAPDAKFVRSPSSDPIETSESDTDKQAALRRGKDPAHTSFMAKIKDKLASTRVLAENDGTEASVNSDKNAVKRRAMDAQKREALQRLKMEALQANLKQSKLPDLPQGADESITLYFSDEDNATETAKAPRNRRASTVMSFDGSPGASKRGVMLASATPVKEASESRPSDAPSKRESTAAHSGPAPRVKKTVDKPQSRQARSRQKGQNLTRKDLDQIMTEKIRQQNIQARRLKTDPHTEENDADEEQADAQQSHLDILLRQVQHEAARREDAADSDDEGNDSDFLPDNVHDGAEIIDYGSASDGVSDDEDVQEGPGSPSALSSLDPAEVQEPAEAAVHIKKRRVRMLVQDDEDRSDGQGGENASTSPRGSGNMRRIQYATVMGPPPMSKENRIDQASPRLEGLHLDADAGFSQFFADTQVADVSSDDKANGQSSATLAHFFLEGTQSAIDSSSSQSIMAILPDSDEAAGFTQLFESGTQVGGRDAATNAMPKNADKLPLTATSGSNDAFAALRWGENKAALLIGDEGVNLPSLDDVFDADDIDEIVALEDAAIRADEMDRLQHLDTRRKNSTMAYLNKDGFFTQTRPDALSFPVTQTQHGAAVDTEGEDATDSPTAPAQTGTTESRNRRRFRRAVSIEAHSASEGTVPSDSEREEDIDTQRRTDGVALPSAFDALRAGQQAQATTREKSKGASIFLEGEAEESDDEETAVRRGKGNIRGGLDGVFSDQDTDAGSGEDSDEDDGKDVENLIDEEVDEDEDTKDKLARARYLQDIDADDQAAQAMHEKAIRGGFRSKRRGRNEDGTLGDFLEDDYEDDWLEKKARNPYGAIAKKRRLQGKDGMDLLAEQEESQAFVLQYRDSHHQGDILDKYAFLQTAEDDKSAMQLLYEDGPPTRIDALGAHDDLSDDVSADEQPRKMTRAELQEEIASIRRRKKRHNKGLLDDDELEAEERRLNAKTESSRSAQLQQMLNRALMPDCSDDEIDDEDQHIKDRLEGIDRIAPQARDGPIQVDDDEDADTGLRFGLNGLATTRRVTERERARLLRLARDYEHEPDWDTLRSGAGTRSRGNGKSAALSNSTGASVSKERPGGSAKALSRTPQDGKRTISSKLQGVMSRQHRFAPDDSLDG